MRDDARCRSLLNQLPQGKACGLNDAMIWRRERLWCSRTRARRSNRGAVRLLAENFADPEVGCVSGELMLGDPAVGRERARDGSVLADREEGSRAGVGFRLGRGRDGRALCGAAGAADRVPPGTILDDVYLPMQVVRQGKRVVFDARARAWDSPNLGAGREFSRKVRTLSGNYQLVQLAPWLLSGSNPIRFEFVSHKLLRLAVPFALALLA